MRLGSVFVGLGGIRSWLADLAVLPLLGAAAYLLFTASASLRPAEAAVLMMAAAGLVLLGRRWLAWQRSLAPESLLADWAGRILRGDRAPLAPPAGMAPGDLEVTKALNLLLEEGRLMDGRLESLHRAVLREWADLDGLMGQVQQRSGEDRAAQVAVRKRLVTFGRDLRDVVERSVKVDRIELELRLRADQHRIQGQAFRAAMEQAQGRLEKVEGLMDDLKETFPRLREGEESLGRLADAGVRQGARLDLAVKGLATHTPRLVEETRIRAEQLRRFRTSADDLRDQAEALARRIEGFRVESQRRIDSFGGAQGAIHVIDQAAQQAGLLAVNTAILAQQGGGGPRLQTIGGRLRGLADQTSQGAADLGRVLDEHQQGMERESAGLWDLQEVTQRLGSGIQELLHVASHLDQQGQDLERTLEAQVALVGQVQEASDRAEQSLLQIGECSATLQSALSRQWGVEAKAAAEMDQLVRTGRHMAEAGRDLSRIAQKNMEEIRGILEGHQALRQSEAYRQIAHGDLASLLGPEDRTDPAWNRVAWARAQRRPRLLECMGRARPFGRPDPTGGIRMLVLGLDALGRPEPSAVADWSCDDDGQAWRLVLAEGLGAEDHRHALQETLRESPLRACLPGTEVHVSAEGVDVRLPFPYPGFPRFLAGLGLDMTVDPAAWRAPLREMGPRMAPVQRFFWCGPGMEPVRRSSLMRLVHAWVRDDPQHETFLLGLPYEGHRPPCPWLAGSDPGERLEAQPKVRCLGLGADATSLRPFLNRLLQAGAQEGEGEAVLCAAALGHDHPEALLLRLFQAGAGMAGAPHPDLAPLRARLQSEVLGGQSSDPYRAAWQLLEDLQRKGWVLPLPSAE
ncbi:methyl-accepting chemotaxis protein [Geothrix alkalitolerans]|uniref:methyl-accepting chemotaxis protein n=1 Tax=Geothrix alkalitolerans TaxID=2922724 RepID=UPI001FAF2784|nr:methyl-accepting chemotaxis protein [Geothrix alkalitolerans]